MSEKMFECAWCSTPGMYHHEKPSTCTACGKPTGLLEYDNKVLSCGLVKPGMTVKDRDEFPHVYTWPARWKFHCTVPSSVFDAFMRYIADLNTSDYYKPPYEIINVDICEDGDLTYIIQVSVAFGKHPVEIIGVLWKNPPFYGWKNPPVRG